MGIIASGKEKEFEMVPAGSYIARCYKMYDIGTQPAQKEGKPSRKVIIFFEILSALVQTETEDGEVFKMHDIRMSDAKPFTVRKQYTLSIHAKSSLGQDINKWRGVPFTKEELDAFDITNLLGAWARLDIVHMESQDGTKVYENIEAVKYTTKKPEAVNPTSWWSVSEPDMEAFDALPDWIKEKVEASEEWQQGRDEVADVGDEPIGLDDLPKEFQSR